MSVPVSGQWESRAGYQTFAKSRLHFALSVPTLALTLLLYPRCRLGVDEQINFIRQ